MIEIKAPNYAPASAYLHGTVFLAGSIDMGSAVDWQSRITEAINETKVTVFNPRRADWDSTWEQSINNAQFREQVEWELKHLEGVDLIVFYFDPNGSAPVTLLELGLFANMPNDVVVCCPEGYWRKGNVDVVCDRYGVKTVDTLEDLINYVKEWANG